MKDFALVAAVMLAGTVAVAQSTPSGQVTSGAAASAQTAQAPAAKPPLTTEQQLAALQKRMLDWAQLGYYRAKNAALAAPAAGEQRVVFYGDSITELWGRSWKASFGDKPYVDRGISGQTSPQMVVRFHQDVVDLHPKVVVILAGTNDIAEKTGPMTPEATLDDFRAMLEMARANGIKVVVGSIPPADDFYWNKGLEPAPKIKAMNAKLEAWCASQGVVWVDYYSALTDEKGAMKPGLSLDGVHPTPAGFALMTPLAEAGIAKALAAK
ncbi:MAG TPA: SGNH/GDSL hydrolase family protein [Acidobacteriaceae bacterium]|jgi:lysophospholipase L1-like esterase